MQTNLRRGRRAAASHDDRAAIPLLSRALAADRKLLPSSSPHRLTLRVLLSKMYYLRGTRLFRSRKYPAAYRSFSSSLKHDRGNSRSKEGLAKVRSKAKALFEEAYVLKDVSPQEARQKWQRVLKMVPSSDVWHRKASRQLGQL